MTDPTSGSRLKKGDKVHFTQVSNIVLYSDRLSFKAKGLYAYMLAKPDDWNFSNKRIANESMDGIDSIKSAIKELIAEGLLEYSKASTGRNIYTIYYNYVHGRKPKVENPTQGEEPKAEKPTEGKTHRGKTPPISKKEINKQRVLQRKEEEEDILLLDDYIEFITEGYKGVRRPAAYRKGVIKKIRQGHEETLHNYESFIKRYTDPSTVDLTTLIDFYLDIDGKVYTCLSCKEKERGSIHVYYMGATEITEMIVPSPLFYKCLITKDNI